MKKSKEPAGLVRAALYIRVSGEEQKIKGLSLEAQQERLEAYAKERGWVIAGVYIDAAKTARKNMHKRAEFQRMIEAVKRDDADVLLLCRLDRWFRSVADYYKVMEILEAHNCNWATSDEEYQIYTAALNQLPDLVEEKPPDFSAVETLLQNNFKQIYETLTREEKRTLWRSTIKEIRIDRENNITGISFG